MGRRGIKICKSCNSENGVRSRTCKSCGAAFEVRATPASKVVGTENGRVTLRTRQEYLTHDDLKTGDLVAVLPNSGPYWEFDRELHDANGNRIYREYLLDKDEAGTYKVVRKTNDGFLGISVADKKSGTHFFYTGLERRSKVDKRLVDSPFKLARVRLQIHE